MNQGEKSALMPRRHAAGMDVTSKDTKCNHPASIPPPYVVLTLRTEVSLVTFGTLAFAFPNAFPSISAGLWAFACSREEIS